MRLAPHTTWAIKQLRDLPIKGIGILAVNEIIAFSIPPLIVLGLRGFLDPIGWQTWSDAPNSGIALLTLAFFVWIFFDFLRIARVRRMMKALEKHDIEKIKKIADAGLKTRKWQDEKGLDRYSTEIQCTEFTFLTPKAEGSAPQQPTAQVAQAPESTPVQAPQTQEDDLPF